MLANCDVRDSARSYLREEREDNPVLDMCQSALSIQGSNWQRVPYGEPLSIIIRVGSEESGHGVVAGDHEAGHVGQELAPEVEEDEEHVERDGADHGVSLGNAGGPLQIDDGRVLGKLSMAVSRRGIPRCDAVAG